MNKLESQEAPPSVFCWDLISNQTYVSQGIQFTLYYNSLHNYYLTHTVVKGEPVKRWVEAGEGGAGIRGGGVGGGKNCRRIKAGHKWITEQGDGCANELKFSETFMECLLTAPFDKYDPLKSRIHNQPLDRCLCQFVSCLCPSVCLSLPVSFRFSVCISLALTNSDGAVLEHRTTVREQQRDKTRLRDTARFRDRHIHRGRAQYS